MKFVLYFNLLVQLVCARTSAQGNIKTKYTYGRKTNKRKREMIKLTIQLDGISK